MTSNAIKPRIKAYKVAAVFSTDMSEYDSIMVFLPLAEAQAYFNRAGDVSAIEIFLDARPGPGRRFPQAGGGRRRTAGLPGRLAAAHLGVLCRAAGRAQRHVPDLTLIVLVAALNIVSGLIMLVKDKGSDIAILRTVGASRGSIMRIFLIAGRRSACSGRWPV